MTFACWTRPGAPTVLFERFRSAESCVDTVLVGDGARPFPVRVPTP